MTKFESFYENEIINEIKYFEDIRRRNAFVDFQFNKKLNNICKTLDDIVVNNITNIKKMMKECMILILIMA